MTLPFTIKKGTAMKHIKAIIIWIVGMAFLSGCATTKEDQNVSGTLSENVVTAAATVKAVNQKTRHVTLQRDDGSLVKIYADERGRKLAQGKVGERVKVVNEESLARG